jgi:hypothetical protein
MAIKASRRDAATACPLTVNTDDAGPAAAAAKLASEPNTSRHRKARQIRALTALVNDKILKFISKNIFSNLSDEN